MRRLAPRFLFKGAGNAPLWDFVVRATFANVSRDAMSLRNSVNVKIPRFEVCFLRPVQRTAPGMLLFLTLVLSMFFQTAHAQMSPDMREGILAYKQGQYKTAVTSLMGALNTEFNNATLHYYLGNCFVHLKQNESAIREFRIAHALAPDQEVGRFSKEVLNNLGVKVDGAAPTPYVPPKPVYRPDPIIAEALESLRQQSQEAQRYENQANDFLNREAEQRHQREIERQRNDMLQGNGHYTRRGRFIQSDKLPADSQRRLDGLKSNFENQSNARKQSSNAKVDELRRTQENLENLLNDKNPKSGVKLKPAGTNLYNRNYEYQGKSR